MCNSADVVREEQRRLFKCADICVGGGVSGREGDQTFDEFQQIDLFVGNIKGPNEESLAGKGVNEFCKLIN